MLKTGIIIDIKISNTSKENYLDNTDPMKMDIRFDQNRMLKVEIKMSVMSNQTLLT